MDAPQLPDPKLWHVDRRGINSLCKSSGHGARTDVFAEWYDRDDPWCTSYTIENPGRGDQGLSLFQLRLLCIVTPVQFGLGCSV